jgi:hypothetical protein
MFFYTTIKIIYIQPKYIVRSIIKIYIIYIFIYKKLLYIYNKNEYILSRLGTCCN